MVASKKEKNKVLFARSALDGHDRGVINVMSRCRDEGIEVVYIYYYDPHEVMKAAMQEDVDVIAITSSLGQHFYVISELKKALVQEKINIPVIIGGVIPGVDAPKLVDMGVKGIFGPGSTAEEAVSFISQIALKEES
jgi:methylmalonyl-CoA mutase C-terminal domain